ncbi:MAG: NAD(P)-dependent oxidoreductase [Alcaligenaceae bacterium]|nr:NAD(P)-dependent oxidoreductase [Alcaligenaceae bacterium]
MKILVTGGAGFLGAWVLRTLLQAGHEARIFDTHDHRGLVHEIVGPAAQLLDWHVGDITNAQSVFDAAHGCDTVVHLAGVLTPTCQADPVQGARINLLGTLHVLEAARREGWPRVAYASSAGVFGPDDGATPYPASLYGTYKLACEGVARAYWSDPGDFAPIASVGLRPLVVYGPGREGGSSAGPSLACRAAARGEAYTVPFSGSTGLVYVEDVAQAFVAAATSPLDGAHVFNMIGDTATLGDFVAELVTQRPDARIQVDGRPLQISAEIRNDDLTSILPGVRHTSIAEGIARTLGFYTTCAVP